MDTITQIIYTGDSKTYIITRDKAIIQRLSLDLKGKPSSDGKMAFDVSFCNLLVITEHKQTKQGLYFQLNLETTKPTEKKVEPKISKAPEVVKQIQKAVNVLEKNNVKVTPNMPRRAPQSHVEPHKTEKPTSIHFKPQEAKNNVVSRFKKGKPQISEEDLWNNED